jgi:hypothetical protein
VKNALENMKELLALYKMVIGNYRPLLDGERYLTDREVAQILKVSRRFLILAAKLLSFGLSTAMQNVAVCGIRTGYDLATKLLH